MNNLPGYNLENKRVLITSADKFMGPDLVTAFNREGSDVIADYGDLTDIHAADKLAKKAGDIDVLIANLAAKRPDVTATDITDSQISNLFEQMVYPLIRIGRAVLPNMLAKRSGKIVVISSAAPLRGFSNASAYAAARGAQLAWVRATGTEVAAENVQINAVAQNFVENPTYFPEEYQQTAAFKQRISQVPSGRLATGNEAASVALFLASENCNFMIGQTIPCAGGWVN